MPWCWSWLGIRWRNGSWQCFAERKQFFQKVTRCPASASVGDQGYPKLLAAVAVSAWSAALVISASMASRVCCSWARSYPTGCAARVWHLSKMTRSNRQSHELRVAVENRWRSREVIAPWQHQHWQSPTPNTPLHNCWVVFDIRVLHNWRSIDEPLLSPFLSIHLPEVH